MGRTSEDLLVKLKIQIRFLAAACSRFDEGDAEEATEIASKARVLLHDTDTSRSLLGQVKVKDRISYLNTADPLDPRNLLSHHGLLVIKMTIPRSGQATFDPSTGEGGQYVPALGDGPVRLSPFQHWWHEIVIKDQAGTTWTRKQIVLELANKEGGSHVHPSQSGRYDKLANKNALGWIYGDGTTEEPLTRNPVYASMRQIGYELEMTLKRELSRRLPGFS